MWKTIDETILINAGFYLDLKINDKQSIRDLIQEYQNGFHTTTLIKLRSVLLEIALKDNKETLLTEEISL